MDQARPALLRWTSLLTTMKGPKAEKPTGESPVPMAEALARLPVEELAAFVARLAENDSLVKRQVANLLARGRPDAASRRVRAQMRQAFSDGGFHDRRGAADYAGELHEILDLIEQAVAPGDPTTAFALLRDFIGKDGRALETADDSDGYIGDVFRRACRLLAQAAKSLPSSEVFPVWEALMAGNDYGCRDELPGLAPSCLAPPEVVTLREHLQSAMRKDGPDAFSAAVMLQSLAEALHDPELYAEAAYRGKTKNDVPAVALGVARQFLAAQRSAEARQHLPGSAEVCGGYAGEWHEVRVALARAAGDGAELRETLWERFAFTPSAAKLNELLAVEPEAIRDARRTEALEFVRRDDRDLTSKLRLLLAAGEVEEAARSAVAQHVRLNGDLYFSLVPLAEAFEPEHPLAATAVYRALLDSILRRAKPATYRHGAAYWHSLEMLAARIEAFAPLLPSGTYAENIRRTHGRKYAFWGAVEHHDAAAYAREREARRRLIKQMATETGDDAADEWPL